jgi:hypothetical protein
MIRPLLMLAVVIARVRAEGLAGHVAARAASTCYFCGAASIPRTGN